MTNFLDSPLKSAFNGSNILITGGLGFIGSNLAIRLVEWGAKVTLIDSLIPEYGGNLWNIEPVKNQVKVNISDVRDEHAMKYLVVGYDFLFNLAGQTSHIDSMNNPFPDLDINAKAQLSILEACRKFNPKIKIVFASTRQIYGKPLYLPVDEKHPTQPVDVNGINKLAGEMYHQLYFHTYGICTSVLRLTNTYGPRMRIKDARQTFLGIWFKNLLADKPIEIFGDGQQIRDFNYIDDLIDALLLAAHSEKAYGQIFNLGADDPLTLEDTAKLLINVNNGGSYLKIPFPPERKIIDIGDYYSNYQKINSILGWKPLVSFKEGVTKTLAYYHQNKHHYWK